MGGVTSLPGFPCVHVIKFLFGFLPIDLSHVKAILHQPKEPRTDFPSRHRLAYGLEKRVAGDLCSLAVV